VKTLITGVEGARQLGRKHHIKFEGDIKDIIEEFREYR